MRVAVTGSQGQLARSLAELARSEPDIDIILVGRPALDLTRPETVLPALAAARPDIVVSAAAWTAVDMAEDRPDEAAALNVAGAEAVAAASAAIGVPLIHLSTDYVYPGDGGAPLTEESPTAPMNVYGRTKLEGERLAALASPRCLIVRTAWLYGPFGSNFVRTMLRLASRRQEIDVVADQFGNPTASTDLARAVATMARAATRPDFANFGVYHVAGADHASWSGLARATMAASAALGGPSAAIRDIPATAYPTRARRPADTRLDTSKYARTFGKPFPGMDKALPDIVGRILREGL